MFCSPESKYRVNKRPIRANFELKAGSTLNVNIKPLTMMKAPRFKMMMMMMMMMMIASKRKMLSYPYVFHMSCSVHYREILKLTAKELKYTTDRRQARNRT